MHQVDGLGAVWVVGEGNVSVRQRIAGRIGVHHPRRRHLHQTKINEKNKNKEVGDKMITSGWDLKKKSF
jgi:hypothetical protein